MTKWEGYRFWFPGDPFVIPVWFMTGRLTATLTPLATRGALFMRAMIWWDRETESVWSQPWGLALDGLLSDSRLDLIPANIAPWDA